jgi:hypothetical protein
LYLNDHSASVSDSNMSGDDNEASARTVEWGNSDATREGAWERVQVKVRFYDWIHFNLASFSLA